MPVKNCPGPSDSNTANRATSQFWQKAPHAPVQQELIQHTKVAWMCGVISANKLAFKGTGSSFSESHRGIQCSHTKAFFLPYNDVGLTSACRVAGGGA